MKIILTVKLEAETPDDLASMHQHYTNLKQHVLDLKDANMLPVCDIWWVLDGGKVIRALSQGPQPGPAPPGPTISGVLDPAPIA
jgi:hypothetical protein